MAEFDVSLAQLQEVCDYFVETEYPYFEELREAFKLLRITGCRIQEIFEIERWSIVSGYEVTCQPQKGNQIRYITLNSDFANFLTAIENQYKPFLGRTVSQLEYLFNKINPYGGLFSGGRSILSYIYRYCYIRELHADGLTNTEIANIMGHNNESVILNYLNAGLSSTIEIPEPGPEGFIFDGITYPAVELTGKLWVTQPLRWDDGLGQIWSYNNNPVNDEPTGKLYARDSVLRFISLLSDGWRLPIRADFNDLASIYAPSTSYSSYFCSTDLAHWQYPQYSNNDTGLTLRGSGRMSYGNFTQLKTSLNIWLGEMSNATYRYVMQTHNKNYFFQMYPMSFNTSTALAIIVCKNL